MRKLLALAFMLSGFLFITSCGEDDGDDVTLPGELSIDVPATAEVENEATYTGTVTVEAEDGLASLVITKDGAAYADTTFTGAPTSATYNFSYTATAADADKNITFEFTVSDVDGDDESEDLVLSVGEAPEVPTTVTVNSNISADATWTAGTTYILAGRITVLDGATLTIEPGTVIKGQAGTGANATALLVARGGMLMAEGTAEMPIIFTSVADEITPADVAAGNFGSPNLNPDVPGLWGGVIVLGRAPISASNDNDQDVSETVIEGIPSTDTNAIYGGDDAEDNSGVLKYISIRHGGSLIAPGNEINGLTLGGVGSGTVIENIEIVANKDDGVEIFGGNVNVTNVLVWNSSDDGLDTDQDWIGTLSNFIIVDPRDGGSAFELDGPEGTLNRGCHTFVNGTVYASNTGMASLVDWDGDTNAEVKDVYFYGMPETYTLANEVTPVASYNGDGCGTSDGWEATLAGALAIADVFGDLGVTAVAANQNTVGADASAFGWTWASKSGTLTEIGL